MLDFTAQQGRLEADARRFFAWLAGHGFHGPKLRRTSQGWFSRLIWVGDELGIEVEIDLREWDAFLLIVRLEDGKVPVDGYYVSLTRGKRCRIHLGDLIARAGLEVDPQLIERVDTGAAVLGDAGSIERRLQGYSDLLRACIDDLGKGLSVFEEDSAELP